MAGPSLVDESSGAGLVRPAAEPSELASAAAARDGGPAGAAAAAEAAEAPLPLSDATEHLELLLRRFAGRLERQRAVRDPGPLDAGGRVFAIERRLAALQHALDARLALSEPAVLPVEQLQRRFGLSDLAIEFLIGAAAPGLDLA